ncbi:MAG TPA: hypothetical protein VK735_08435 [Pseudonocardia sp.]|uniref:hypothetical protein n=1 Tax=Pseudonocardia sp. TaxID=60912 RepID=UPI002CF9E7EC|nr:hypothetical protein [Pseudonocardia sp.]HTF47458.1 hypothetical protein [Pseudonocardia sp.]
MSKPTLRARQAALVAALVAGAPVPAGFDERLVDAAARSLRHKRAGEVAAVWPLLAAGLGEQWHERFRRWARGRPPQGALRDGWDLARELAFVGELPALAEAELAMREVGAPYDGRRAPRPRRGFVARRVHGGVAVGLLGRVHLICWRENLRIDSADRGNGLTNAWRHRGRRGDPTVAESADR